MTNVDELFLMNLLRSMVLQKQGERPRFSFTKEDVRQRYSELHPPLLSRLFKKLGARISQGKIDKGLTILVERGFVDKEITRFTYKVLKVDTPVYSVTAKGRDFLNPSKGKR